VLTVELWAAASIAKAFDALETYRMTEQKKLEPLALLRNFLSNHPHELAQGNCLRKRDK
jgi:uncharacterized protein YbgA (DUF1722 family)